MWLPIMHQLTQGTMPAPPSHQLVISPETLTAARALCFAEAARSRPLSGLPGGDGGEDDESSHRCDLGASMVEALRLTLQSQLEAERADLGCGRNINQKAEEKDSAPLPLHEMTRSERAGQLDRRRLSDPTNAPTTSPTAAPTVESR